jgi:hypothetical protein
MRSFLILIVIGGLGAVYVWQKKGDPPQPVAKAQTTQAAAAQPGASASPAREVSEHNWMKRSLDRARDVSQQARAKTKESQDP